MMNDLNDLFIAEIKNLYALEKQTSEILENINDSASHKKLVKRLKKVHNKTSKHFKIVHATLQQMQINPGNVVDAIVREISDNLQNLKKMELPSDLRDVSLWTSLNRLLSYQVACYENVTELAIILGQNKIAKDLSKCLRATEKELYKLHGKTKNKVFTKAIG